MDCVFCKIIAGELPCVKVYEDDLVSAFKDIRPLTPVHIIIIPKEHIESADSVTGENSRYIARIFEVIPKIAADLGITNGYRIVTNIGSDAGQTVFHIHFHLLAGREMTLEMA